MFTELKKIDNLIEIQQQVSELVWNQKRIALNESSGGLFSGPYTVKKEYVGTPLGDLLESLGIIGEARLLKLESSESYTAHTDPDDRIHLAIETNPYAYIMDLDENKLHHLPADGTVWLMDTSKKHLAGNFGGFPRIHLNIRAKLPAYQSGGFHIEIGGGGIDWKQDLYIETMSYINHAVKNKSITGIEKINERELLLNCELDILDELIKLIEIKGFKATVSKTDCTL